MPHHVFPLLACVLGAGAASAETVISPDGRISADVTVNAGRLSYTVSMAGTTVIETSMLGFTMNGADRGATVTMAPGVGESIDQSFPSRQGMHATARDHYNAKKFGVTHTPTGETYTLNVRAYDSGIAFRYELTYTGAKNITAEATAFSLPASTRVSYQSGPGVYENTYGSADIAAIGAGTVLGPPAVGRLGTSSNYVAITHSGPGAGFPNPYLTKIAGGTGRQFQNTFLKNQDNTFGASSGAEVYSPWNIITAGDLTTLANSDIVESVAPEPDPAIFPDGSATTWARPGRSVWDWMSRFPGGITAENSKIESYWASQIGAEYNTIDEGWANWNGGNPWPQVADVTQYSSQLGVKVLVWTRSVDIQTRAQRAAFFQKLKDNGVAGFKADFFDFNSVSPAAKERVRLIDRILKEAAAYHLVVDLHGTGKPLGQFRTYPNLLNIEAVYGKESFPDAATSSYVPLTRFLAGPADFTPLGLQGTLQGGQTQAYEIATVANMAGPLITLAERGDRIAQSPFASVIKGIPCLWDETRVLPGTVVGESCAMARRTGTTWYVSIMNSGTARTWPLDFSFLTPGTTYQAEIVKDGATAVEYRTLTRADSPTASTAASGGYVARITIPAATSINTLPFGTSFGMGRGAVYAENGQILSTTPWANTLLTERAPDVRWSVSGSSLTPVLDETDPYQGGVSLKVTGDLQAATDLPLFTTSLSVSSATRLGLSFKNGTAGSASGLQVALTFADAPGAPVYLNAGNAATAGWNDIELNLGAYAGRTISAIGLRFASATPNPGYAVKIGRIKVYNTPLAPVSAPTNFRAEQVTITGLDTLTCTLKWDAAAGGIHHYSVYQVNPLTGQRAWLGATTSTSLAVTTSRMGEETAATFEVAAIDANGTASTRPQTAVTLPPRPVLTNPLSGTIIGTTGSFQNSGATRDKVFDGDTTTFFDAAVSDGVWAGIDLGAGNASKVVAVRYFPRDAWSARMTGGSFQGSNNGTFTDAVTLATVASQPVEGQYTAISITNAQTFRYLRYLSPNGGWGNVAEVKFYGPGAPAAPSGVGASRNGASAIINWAPSASAQFYKVKRSTTAGGPYQVIAESLTGTSFSDTGLADGTSYYYVVSLVSSDGVESANSAEAAAVDLFQQWAAARGLTGATFSGDANGNGIPDGIEYAAPAGVALHSHTGSEVALYALLALDSFLIPVFQKSNDLTTWIALEADSTPDQTGVPSGYRRISVHDLQATGNTTFYRLQVSR